MEVIKSSDWDYWLRTWRRFWRRTNNCKWNSRRDNYSKRFSYRKAL